jgi:hypothetical protein
VASPNHYAFELPLGHLSWLRFHLIDQDVVLIVDFAVLPDLICHTESVFKLDSAFSFEVEVRPTYLFRFLVVEPFDVPSPSSFAVT